MISVILPTYNSLGYLTERVDSILNQSYTDWECIVIDGKSTDGTWEYLTELSKNDKRFELYQFEPKGVYHAWNKGVKLANGHFIYFATSDDTMTKDCLEKMVQALKSNPSCSIAHCCLNIINENSDRNAILDWYKFPAQQYFKELTHEYHIRKAPLCGILYATHQTIIHSFTQILIRKEVFDTINYFLEDQGSEADLEWGMRATLSENIIHVPHELATWRVHAEQQTVLKPTVRGKKHILSLQIKAIKNAKIDKALKKELLTNQSFLQAISIKQLLSNYTFFKKLRSKYYWQMKKLIRRFSGLHGIINRRNDYFEYDLKKIFKTDVSHFIIDNAKKY